MKKGYSWCVFISFYITPSKRVYMTQVNSFKTVKKQTGKKNRKTKTFIQITIALASLFFFFKLASPLHIT